MLTSITGIAGCILTTAQLPLGVLRRKLRRDHRKYLMTASAAVLVEFWVGVRMELLLKRKWSFISLRKLGPLVVFLHR